MIEGKRTDWMGLLSAEARQINRQWCLPRGKGKEKWRDGEYRERGLRVLKASAEVGERREGGGGSISAEQREMICSKISHRVRG